MTNNKLTLSETIEQAIEAIREKTYTDERYKSAILDRLLAIQNLETNLWAIAITIGSIRNIAQKNKIPENGGVLNSEDLAQYLKEIEKMANLLHNVPGYLINGTPCDGLYLYRNGVDANWPTGISAGKNGARIYYPRYHSSLKRICENVVKEMSLTDEDIRRLMIL
jgi:hypothetical protein